MAGVADDWSESTVMFAGKPVHQMVLKQQPKVTLLELRMPGGAVRGGKVPLGLMWDQGETINTYPINNDGSNATHYDRAETVATIQRISHEMFVDLEPGMMVRIGAKTKRTIRVGDEGLKAIAIGGTPGEAFTPLPYTEIGALDPLLKRPGT